MTASTCVYSTELLRVYHNPVTLGYTVFKETLMHSIEPVTIYPATFSLSIF